MNQTGLPIRTTASFGRLLALAIFVFIAAILILRGFVLAREPGRPATFGVGLMAGVLNGSMGIVGPLAILFYFSSPIGVVAGRASIITYFIGTDSVGTAMFAAQGLIDTSVYWRTAVFLPILIAGVVVGNRGFVKTDPRDLQEDCALRAHGAFRHSLRAGRLAIVTRPGPGGRLRAVLPNLHRPP